MVDLLFAGLSAPAAIGLVLASFVTSMIAGAFGLGGGLVLLAILASILPPTALIPVHGLVQLGSNAGRAMLLAGDVVRSVLPAFTIGSLVGVAIGGVIVVDLPATALQIVVGVFILWSVFGKPAIAARGSASFLGLFSSFLTMFIGGTGPFIAAYVKALQLDRVPHVATHAALMSVQHALKTATFAVLGFAFATWLPLIILMIASGFAGTVAGRRILLRINEKLFQRILNTILVLLALRLIGSAILDTL